MRDNPTSNLGGSTLSDHWPSSRQREWLDLKFPKTWRIANITNLDTLSQTYTKNNKDKKNKD